MAALPAITPRLVFHAADVQDVLADLSEEHAALLAELLALELELESISAASAGWKTDEALVRDVTKTLEELCGARRDSVLAELEAEVVHGEQAAAERIAAAEREAAHHLDTIRSEVVDRLVAEVDLGGPGAAGPAARRPPVAVLGPHEPEAVAVAVAIPPVRASAVEPAEAVDDERPAAVREDQEADTDRFRAFWSEQEEIASIREAIAAALFAVAPMALALLAIVILLLLVL